MRFCAIFVFFSLLSHAVPEGTHARARSHARTGARRAGTCVEGRVGDVEERVRGLELLQHCEQRQATRLGAVATCIETKDIDGFSFRILAVSASGSGCTL